MSNPVQNAAKNRAMCEDFDYYKNKMQTTFAGFDYEFKPGKAADVPKEERMKLYEELYHAGEQRR